MPLLEAALCYHEQVQSKRRQEDYWRSWMYQSVTHETRSTKPRRIICVINWQLAALRSP